jgi:hypothetical protein
MLLRLFLFIITFGSCLSALAQEWTLIPGYERENGAIVNMDVSEDSIVFLGVQILVGYDHSYGAFSWDSLNLNPVGTDSENRSFGTMASFQDELYFGGNIKNYADIDSADIVVRFSDGVWNSLGQGICQNTANANDFAVYNDQLVVCGLIDEVDCDEETAWMRMARWNGEAWFPMGGVSSGGEPVGLIEFQGLLYVYGHFSSVSNDNTFENSLLVQSIAWWDGEIWGEPEEGLNGFLFDAVVDEENDLLYVCGFFTDCSGTLCSHVSVWDGEQWSIVGDYLAGDINSLAFYRGQLYAAGSQILGYEGLVFFDGAQWQPVPNCNFNGSVKAIDVFKDELYIAGSFTYNEDIPTTGLIKYYLHPDSVVWAEPSFIDRQLEFDRLTMHVFPNPVQDELTMEFNAKVTGQIRFVSASGVELQRAFLQDRKKYTIDLSKFPVGAYHLEFSNEVNHIIESVIIIR